MFQVLSSRPETTRTGEYFTAFEKDGTPKVLYWERVTNWRILGTASNMEDAKAKYGDTPALQWIGSVH